jgi:hypothetical protein
MKVIDDGVVADSIAIEPKNEIVPSLATTTQPLDVVMVSSNTANRLNDINRVSLQ